MQEDQPPGCSRLAVARRACPAKGHAQVPSILAYERVSAGLGLVLKVECRIQENKSSSAKQR